MKAACLILLLPFVAIGAPQAPYLFILPEYVTNKWYFAATATDRDALESDYSNEVSVTNVWGFTNLPINVYVLAWDPSPGTNVVTNYQVYFGPASAGYTNKVSAGTNLTVGVRVIPLPLTNIVLTVTTTGTNLYRASSVRGPWISLNRTNYVATNSPSPYFFRGKGASGNTVSISVRKQ